MNQQLKMTLAITGIAAALSIAIFAGWRSFGPAPGDMDQATIDAHFAAKKADGPKYH